LLAYLGEKVHEKHFIAPGVWNLFFFHQIRPATGGLLHALPSLSNSGVRVLCKTVEIGRWQLQSNKRQVASRVAMPVICSFFSLVVTCHKLMVTAVQYQWSVSYIGDCVYARLAVWMRM